MRRQPFRLHIPPPVSQRIAETHPLLKRRLREALEAVAVSPDAGKPLQDQLAGQYSWRVGRYRIVYRILAGRVVDVVTVGLRRYVYDEARQIVRARAGIEKTP